jgi:putative oxidoreductase
MANIFTTQQNGAGQPRWLTILRIALGLILFWKSVNFIRDTAAAKMLIERTGIALFSQNSDVLAFVISYLGLLCGLFIAVGLLTRIACIIQIPVLLVAVFLINIRYIGEGVFEFVLSIITLLLLILFAIKGSGNISLDSYFRRGAAIDKDSRAAF